MESERVIRANSEKYPASNESSGAGKCIEGLIWCTFPFSLCVCMKQVQEYERAVIFRLGRAKKGGAQGPGLFFIIPCMDNISVVDLRTVTFDVPPQEILSKDSVTVAVDAVVYYKIRDPMAAVCNVQDSAKSTRLLASTTLRNILGTKTLAEILSDREVIGESLLTQLDTATDPWGIEVERVEIKDVRLPQQLQRAWQQKQKLQEMQEQKSSPLKENRKLH